MMTWCGRGAFLGMCVSAAVLAACDSGGSVSPSSAPTIVTLQPSAGPVGTRVTITGTGFRDNANTINFGSSAYPNVVGQNGTTIVFSIPVATNPPCRNATPPCAIASTLITPGAYALSVTNSIGTSNSTTFTVTSS
jgi:IPT/TIG domain-containing protein